jgi:putative transposase
MMSEIVADMGLLEKTIKKSAFPEEAERAAIRELVVAARARGEDLTDPDGCSRRYGVPGSGHTC